MRWLAELRENWVLLMVALIWLSIPVGLVWGAAAVVLQCERVDAARPTCTLITTRDVRAVGQIDFPAAELVGAEVEASTDSDGDTTYQLVLQLERGPLPFTEAYASGRDDQDANAERVRQFVADRTQASLLISEDNRLTNYLIAGVMVAILVFVAVVFVRA
jgi:hypothetical protein